MPKDKTKAQQLRWRRAEMFLLHAKWYCLFGGGTFQRCPDAGDLAAAKLLSVKLQELRSECQEVLLSVCP